MLFDTNLIIRDNIVSLLLLSTARADMMLFAR